MSEVDSVLKSAIKVLNSSSDGAEKIRIMLDEIIKVVAYWEPTKCDLKTTIYIPGSLRSCPDADQHAEAAVFGRRGGDRGSCAAKDDDDDDHFSVFEQQEWLGRLELYGSGV